MKQEITHAQFSSLGGKSSWAKQIQGKTKEEIHEMMAKRAKRRKKKVVKP